MNIFFDVDLTIISEDGSLRPGVRELFHDLRSAGHTIYLWSGNGIRWSVLDRYGLRDLVAGCFFKPLHSIPEALARQGLPQPDFCVDDYPECVEQFGGVVVKPYGLPDPADGEMARVGMLIARGRPLSRFTRRRARPPTSAPRSSPARPSPAPPGS